MQRNNSPSRKEKAQSLVELAFSLMFILLLVAGVVDLGRAFFTYIALRDAAQEGAAFASIAREEQADAMTCSDIVARTRATSNTPIDLQSGDIAVEIKFFDILNHIPGDDDGDGNDDIDTKLCSDVTNVKYSCLGQEVEITVTYASFPLTTPFMGTILGSQTIPIQARIKDTVLTPPCH